MKESILREDMPYFLAVHKTLNLTLPRFTKLKSYFCNDWQSAWNTSLAQFHEAGIDRKGIEKFFAVRKDISPELLLQKLEQCGSRPIIYGSDHFPLSLQHISNPPIVLFCRGELKNSFFSFDFGGWISRNDCLWETLYRRIGRRHSGCRYYYCVWSGAGS